MIVQSVKKGGDEMIRGVILKTPKPAAVKPTPGASSS
jgi:hypothetical protein